MLKFIGKQMNKKGFTLIELVIVIAILGLLAAVAIPRLSGSRQKAAISSHNSNVRILEGAATSYIAEVGLPSGDDIVWDSESAEALDYLQKWPSAVKGTGNADAEAGPYTVTIKGTGAGATISPDAGKIFVSPGKFDETGAWEPVGTP